MKFRHKYLGFKKDEVDAWVKRQEKRGSIVMLTEDRSEDMGKPSWWGWNATYITLGDMKRHIKKMEK